MAGIVTCGSCGRKFVYDTAVQSGEVYFRCSGRMKGRACVNTRSIAHGWLVGEIKTELCRNMLTEENIAQEFARLQREAGSDAGERRKAIVGLERQAEKIRGQIARLVEELSIGEISRTAITAKLEELEKRLAATQSGISDEAKLRGLLLGLGVRIVAGKDEIKVETGTSLSTDSGFMNAEEGRLPIPKVWRLYPMTSAALPVPAGWSTPAKV